MNKSRMGAVVSRIRLNNGGACRTRVTTVRTRQHCRVGAMATSALLLGREFRVHVFVIVSEQHWGTVIVRFGNHPAEELRSLVHSRATTRLYTKGSSWQLRLKRH